MVQADEPLGLAGNNSTTLVWNSGMADTALGILIQGGNCFGLIAPVLTEHRETEGQLR